MREPTLVILAAGLGSRYGGAKQIDPIDEYGNLIIDFSIYDALYAGFKNIVFIIKREIEADFKEVIGNRIEKKATVKYVYQELDSIYEGMNIPKNRTKPYGTGHAILCCKDVVDGPFAVINADDFYGRSSFELLYNFLTSKVSNNEYCMIGYILKNTLTENGYVARGVCNADDSLRLTNIVERTKIKKDKDKAFYTEDEEKFIELDTNSLVSMNMWGFSENIFEELEKEFKKFFKEEIPENPLKAEFLLPTVVEKLLKDNKTTVEVIPSHEKWFGVTYKEDKQAVVETIKKLKENAIYPIRLWGE